MSLGLVVVGLVVGGVVRHQVKVRKEKQEVLEMRRRLEQLERERSNKKSQIKSLKSELNAVKCQSRNKVEQLEKEQSNKKAQINSLKSQLNSVKSQVKNKVSTQYNCIKKESFYDVYRELDVKLSRTIGKGEQGINVYIRSSEMKNVNSKIISKLKRCKAYRNMISHSKDKWKNMADPEPWMTDFLKDLLLDVKCNNNKYAKLMSVASNKFKYYN